MPEKREEKPMAVPVVRSAWRRAKKLVLELISRLIVGLIVGLILMLGAAEIEKSLAEETKQEQVKGLLSGAEADLSERRLTSPAGNNAWEKYQEALRLSPNNAHAQAGMERVLAVYMELFGEVLARGDWEQADAYLSQIRDLHSDSPLLDKGEKRLAKAKTEALLAGEMMKICGDTFRMGDLSGEGDADERPVHAVKVRSFWMGKHEVKLSQWNACAADGKCNYKKPSNNKYPDKHPVINVSWDEVWKFIKWLNAKTGRNYRLPTESEWEYAARAGNESLYSWGDRIVGVSRANCSGSCGDQWDKTASVGSFEEESAWGLHDMHGNVWEWVEDCWNKNYRGAPGDGSAWLSGDCSLRVIRGGSWGDGPWNLRSSTRDRNGRSARGSDLGFRLARDL